MTQSGATKQTYLKDLILLFAVPIAIAIIASLFVYIPRRLVVSRYDFVYSICNSYSCTNGFAADSSGHISETGSVKPNDYYGGVATLRYYSATDDSTRSLSLEDANRLKFNTSSKSPDGYTVENESKDGGFLFGSGSGESWYIKKGLKKKKLSLANNDRYGSQPIVFMGWVQK